MTPASRAARRQEILRAARRCFARKGFSATTISDLSAESGISAGGIYTHFENKHAIAAAIGDSATDPEREALDLGALGRHLSGPEGEEDARLDLQLWAESLHDPVLHEMVIAALDQFRSAMAASNPAVLEALALGAEVQRALGRPIDLEALEWAIDRLAPSDRSDA